MSKLHLSYDEFKYFYGDLGVTYWTEYNWLSNDYVGKYNVWDEVWKVGSINDTTGEEESGSRVISANFNKVIPNKTYYLGIGVVQSVYIYFYNENKIFISFDTKYNANFTTPSNCYYIKIKCTGAYGTTYNHNIRIYQSVLDLEKKDFGECDFVSYGSPYADVYYTTDIAVKPNSINYLKGYNWNLWQSLGNMNNKDIQTHPTLSYIYLKNSDVANANALKESLKGNYLIYIKA